MNINYLLAFVGVYFLLVLGVTVYERVRTTGAVIPGLEEFFLASRNLSPFVLSATYIGSVFSAFFAIGLPGFVYTNGLGGLGFLVIADALAIYFIFTLYKQIRSFGLEHDLYSPIECLSVAYGSKLLGALIAFLMMFFLAPYIAIQLVGIGKFLEGLTGGELGYINGVGAMMIVVALYLVFGGMRAVAYTDLIQVLAIFIGIFGSGFYFVYQYWDGFSALFIAAQKETPAHLHLPGPEGFYDPVTFISYCIFSIGIFFQPHLITRGMMAKDDRQLNIMGYSFLLAALLSIFPSVLFGLGGFLLYGGEVESNQIMGKIFEGLSDLPFPGIVFVTCMLVGALGAAMSTADSLLLAIGQVFTRDIVHPYCNIEEGRQILLSKFVMLIVLAGAFVIGLNPPKLMGDLALLSCAALCTLIPTYVGFLWSKRTLLGAALSIVSATIVLLSLVFTGYEPFGLHHGFVTLLTSTIVYLGVCVATHKQQR